MISIEGARQQIVESVTIMPSETLEVSNALGRFTTTDIQASIDLPLFDASAMDGYVFSWGDYEGGMRLFPISGEMKAGDSSVQKCIPQTAMAIYTGAPIPQLADSVVMVEKCQQEGNYVRFPDGLSPHQHIRRKGEQIQKGEIAVPANFKLNASALSYLSALGITNIEVTSLPKITILTTGNEIISAGEDLKAGCIYESNGMALKSLFSQAVTHLHAKDEEAELLKQIEEALKTSDWLIITGGISAGKYDLVADCLAQAGVEKQFHKVNQKPGKPFYFGRKEQQLIFALPGNPAAVISCFYLYLYPAWQLAQGAKELGMKKIQLPLKDSFFNKGNRAQLLKAYTNLKEVSLLKGQGSHILHSFSRANALVHLPDKEQQYQEGDIVNVYLLPNV